jgi:hypothetical protein
MGSLGFTMPSYRLVAFALLSALLLLIALPVAAVSEEGGDAEVVSDEDGSAEVVSDYTPAVVVDTGAPEAGDEPWTTRFLVPTGLLLAGVALFGTAVQYFTKVVRSRYKVVE